MNKDDSTVPVILLLTINALFKVIYNENVFPNVIKISMTSLPDIKSYRTLFEKCWKTTVTLGKGFLCYGINGHFGNIVKMHFFILS